MVERATREAGEEPVGTEHMLLALAEEAESVAGRVLREVGVTVAEVRTAIERVASSFHPEGEVVDGRTLRTSGLIGKSGPDQADQLGHNYVGTEHLLLGLLVQQGTHAQHVFRELRVDEGILREHIATLLTTSIADRVRAGRRP